MGKEISKCKKIGEYKRWTSSEIEKVLKEFKKPVKVLRKYSKDEADYYENKILPLTPWISPKKGTGRDDRYIRRC